jgi:hypothetical protein
LFLYLPVETLPVPQNAASRFGVVWNRKGMSSQLYLEKVRREIEGDEDLNQKILTVIGTKVSWFVEGVKP